MRLIDILEVVDDNTTVFVTRGGELIASANGKDCVPSDLNSAEVVQVYNGCSGLEVEVNPIRAWIIDFCGHGYGPYYSKSDAIYQVHCMQSNDHLKVKLSDIRKATKEELEYGIME